ncbi:MAG: ATP-binding protein, partial [Clostridiaceae bacterium]|nr:ATP-binding protein [Clostridiaceae bacterium]
MESGELLQLITKGETREIEFKSWIKAKSKKELMSVIAKEAVALANTFGGYIFVGVEDNGEVTGCDDYDIQNIIESIYDRTVPKLFTDIEEVNLSGKIILTIKVEKADHLISTSAGEVFKRLGKNSKPLFPDEYHLNEVTKTTKDFSTLGLAETSENDINSLEVYKLKERLRSRDPEST